MRPPAKPESDSPAATILIVDDAMDMRVFISALFRTSGYRTVACRDGSAALAKAREQAPDLIVLDVMMPGTGGASMYQRLKADPRLRRIPVIMLSAVGQRSFQHYLKMLNINMAEPLPDPDAYLEKPPDARQLLETAVRLLERKEG